MLREPKAPRARRGRIARTQAQAAIAGADHDLFQKLREKRMEIARAQNVPPYVIFHDRTLIELAAAKPSSRAEMANVPGVGEAKLDRYGPAFLSVIAEHA
jgi:ATP-dependent DNA helicase RecQ